MKVQKNAFRFCRWSVAAIVWAGLILKSETLMSVAFLILLSSALLTIRYAPMILLYQATFGRIGKQEKVELDIKAMRFAHTLGTALSGSVVLLLIINSRIGWALALVFALIKTISAIGFCPAEKLYRCAKGGCCVR